MKRNISIDAVTVLTIAIPMIALLFVGYLSYVNIGSVETTFCLHIHQSFVTA